MDAEEYRIKMSEFPNPRTLTLTNLVQHIVASEKLITTYETMAELGQRKEFPGEHNAIIATTKERLSRLYAELKAREEEYES